MSERTFRFNPFTIKDQDDRQIIEQYTELSNSIVDGDEPSTLAHNIDVYANMNYLIGEMIARYGLIVANMEAELKVAISNEIYKERDLYCERNAGKPPAMSYFENRALSKYLKENNALNEKESLLRRFKIAYESLGDKQNALKKKLEAVKFDLYNQ